MKLFCNLDKKTIIITESQRKKIQEMIAYHPEGKDCQQEEDNHAVALAEVIGAGQLHRYI